MGIHPLRLEWRKSTRCDSSACVEVAAVPADGILVRDSTIPAGPVLSFSKADWADFIRRLDHPTRG